MIGRNTIGLNQATLCAAVQMYLDSQRRPEAPPITVTSVFADKNLGTTLHVIVDVTAKEPDDAG